MSDLSVKSRPSPSKVVPARLTPVKSKLSPQLRTGLSLYKSPALKDSLNVNVDNTSDDLTIVKDCIYGFIEIPSLCRLFLDLPSIQNLRHKHQLGFVSWVYPSATHSRYEHSLGVMAKTYQFLLHLRKYYPGLITDREVEIVCLAALYHDAGHGPGSHFTSGSHEKRSQQHLETENMIVKQLYGDVALDDEELLMVQLMITGIDEDINFEDLFPKPIETKLDDGSVQPEKTSEVSSLVRARFNKNKRFLFQIVANHSGVDTDRLDYLQRDAYHTGMPKFQPDYIIRCARIRNNSICFLKKAYRDIVSMYKTRQHMFETVYIHKTVVSLEKHIRNIIEVEKIQLDPMKDNDIDLMYKIKQSPLYNDIIYRTWQKQKDNKEELKHISYFTDEEIKASLDKITFI